MANQLTAKRDERQGQWLVPSRLESLNAFSGWGGEGGIAWHGIRSFAPTALGWVKVVVVVVTVCGEGSIGAVQVPHSSALPGMMNPLR